MRLSTAWLPAAVIDFQLGICCNSCCTVAFEDLLAAMAGQLVKRVDDAAAAVGLQVQVDHGGGEGMVTTFIRIFLLSMSAILIRLHSSMRTPLL